jgi:hypothetical protein
MGVGRFAPAVTQGWLAEMLAKQHYGALMVGDPFITSDPLAVELLGASYRRPKIIFEQVGQLLRNTNSFNWLGIPPQSRIVGAAGFDAPYNGSIIWYFPLDTPLDFAIGGSWAIAAQDLYLGIDS